MNEIIKKNSEVEHISSNISLIDSKWIKKIKKKSLMNKSGKFRTCIHSSEDSKVHEMLIVHCKNTYVRPHKHKYSGESIHILEGKCDLLLFNNNGTISHSFKLGDISSGLPFFFNVKKSQFHTFVIKTKFLIFKETKSGPFKLNNTVYAPWSPSNPCLPLCPWKPVYP